MRTLRCQIAMATALFSILGCVSQNSDIDTAVRILPGKRVGPYVIGQSTEQDLLGSHRKDMRQEYGERGLHFQFDDDGALSHIVVRTERFMTAEGLGLGSSEADVRRIFGKPKPNPEPSEDNFEGDSPSKRIVIPVLVYDGIGFYILGGSVVMIMVAPN